MARGLPLDQPLMRGSVAEFRAFFARGFIACHVEALEFRPYSIRRGGATFDYMSFGDLNRSIARGRWASSRVARQYIVEGWQQLVNLQLTPAIQARLAELRQNV